jgi:hypothetical protein
MARLKNGNLWLQHNTQQLSDTKTLSNVDNQFQFLDPNGANRDVLLPPTSTAGGLEFTIANTASMYSLIVKDNTGVTTITTIEADEISKFVCNGIIWRTMGGVPEGFLISDNYLMADGSVPIAGDFLPEMTGASGVVSERSIGSSAQKFKSVYAHDVFVDAGSLYINEKKVIEDISDTITIKTDDDQDLKIKTTGLGDAIIESDNEIDLNAKGGVEITVPSNSPTKHINVTNQSANGNITFSADGINAQVQFSGTDEIDLTAPLIDINGDVNISGNIVVAGQGFGGIVPSGIWNFGNATLSGTGDICCSDLYIRDLEFSIEDSTTVVINRPTIPSYGIDEFTVLMLHMDGTNGSTNIVDSSSYNHTIDSITGSFHLDTGQSKFGASSLSGDGQTGHITIPDSNDWYFGTGDLTIDFWFKPNTLSNSSGMTIMSQRDSSKQCPILIMMQTATYGSKYTVLTSNYWSEGGMFQSTTVPSVSRWDHVAIVRYNGTFTLYINGVSEATRFNNVDLSNFSDHLQIGGASFTDTYTMNAHLDEFRISKGIARWTENFIPPNQPYYASIVSFSKELSYTDHTHNFLSLTDTPSTYSEAIGKFAQATNSGIVWATISSGITDHGLLSGLIDDDHPQYILSDGTRAFTSTVSGVTPIVSSHIATKGYVDTTISGNSGGMSWSVITGNTNAVAGRGYLINASTTLTITLPASPGVGDSVGVCDVYNKATTYMLTIDRNSNNIEGLAEDMTIDTNGSGFVLVYVDATRGWEIVSEIGAEVNEIDIDALKTYFDEVYDAIGTASSGIASSIVNGDTTHSPDGNSVYDALALKANVAAPFFTGSSSFVADDDTAIWMSLKRSVGYYGGIHFKTGELQRWLFGVTNAAESGSNVGTALFCQYYDDAGAYLGTLFSAPRNTGIMAITQTPTFPTATLGDNSTKGATTAFVAANSVAKASPIYDDATNFYRINNPGGGHYSAPSSPLTGALYVTLPVGYNSTMIMITIKIYDHAVNESFTVVTGGYLYSSGSTWQNCTAYILGNPNTDRNLTVRFGITATAKTIIYIGELASTWGWPSINVTEVQCSYAGYSSSWLTGWSCGIEASAFAGVTVTLSNVQIGNIGLNTYNSTDKTTLVANDSFPISDSAAANITKKVTLTNLVSTLGSYFPNFNNAISSPLAGITENGLFRKVTGEPYTTISNAGMTSDGTNVTITSGNLKIGAAGKGIDFSVTTDAANMTQEIFNDYEVGYWTIGVTFGGASVGVTISLNQGIYVKVGMLVTCTGYFRLTSKGSSTGQAFITGFPYTAYNESGTFSPVSLGYIENFNTGGVISGLMNTSDTRAYLCTTTLAGVMSYITNAHFANNTAYGIHVAYLANI